MEERKIDYYPFGMTEPGRSWNSGDYRFGYTGHEKENDLAEGVYTTEYRLLDTRLGRWLSVDPLFGKYPDMSAYNYCGGNPVVMVDPDGNSAISILAKRVLKQGIKKGIREYAEKNIKSRLQKYMSKDIAKQFGKDLQDVLDIFENSWWETAIEFVPVAGDIYGAGKFTKQVVKAYDKLQDLENKYVKKIYESLPKAEREKFKKAMRNGGVRDARRDQKNGVEGMGEKYVKDGKIDGHHKERVADDISKSSDPRNIEFMKHEDHVELHKSERIP